MVLQSDGIQHAHWCIRNPWRGIAEAFFWRSTLDSNAAKQRKIIQLCKLTAKAEASAGWNDGVF